MTDSDPSDVASVLAARDTWHRIRVGAALLYTAALAMTVIFSGVPTGRQTIAVIIVIGLAISRLGHGWRPLTQVVLDWLPFTLVLMAYDRTRSVADAIGLPLHEADVARWERALFGGNVPSVVLQHWWYDPRHVHWYDAACTLIYTSHFLATPALAAVLWLRERTEWLRFISRVIALSVAGLATYILFPEAPPWLAARDGVIADPVGRLSARGWAWLHASNLQTALDHAQQSGANPVAAMPSLHVAFAGLVAIFVASRLRSTSRWLLAVYPVAMGVTLVYFGEHYVVDLIAGVGYAAGVHLGLNAWERRCDGRRTVRDAPPVESIPGDSATVDAGSPSAPAGV